MRISTLLVLAAVLAFGSMAGANTIFNNDYQAYSDLEFFGLVAGASGSADGVNPAYYAQSFVANGNYTLTSVSVRFIKNDAINQFPNVSLWDNGPGDVPGLKLADLAWQSSNDRQPPLNYATADVTYVPSSSISLTSGTRYWVQAEVGVDEPWYAGWVGLWQGYENLANTYHPADEFQKWVSYNQEEYSALIDGRDYYGQDTSLMMNVQGDLVGGAPVPEPMTMLAIGMGLAGLGGYIRRRTATK